MSCRLCDEHLQAAEEGLAIDQQVGDNNNHTPTGDGLGHAAQDLLDVGLVAGPAHIHRLDDAVDVSLLAARRQDLAHVLVEGDDANGVLLPQQQIAQAGRDGATIIVLVQRSTAVVHRLADVHHQVATQIGLGLELFDIEAIRFGPYLPVEVANVVAGGVFPVLYEFDRMAEERAAVHARDETLDNVLGAQIEAGNAQWCPGARSAADLLL